jgi:hypothetical protein
VQMIDTIAAELGRAAVPIARAVMACASGGRRYGGRASPPGCPPTIASSSAGFLSKELPGSPARGHGKFSASSRAWISLAVSPETAAFYRTRGELSSTPSKHSRPGAEALFSAAGGREWRSQGHRRHASHRQDRNRSIRSGRGRRTSEKGYYTFGCSTGTITCASSPTIEARASSAISCGPGYLVDLLTEGSFYQRPRHRLLSREGRACSAP